jgi:molybdate transport system regulatory protein
MGKRVMNQKVTCQVRIMVGKGLGMGPGKAAMLRAIQATRSINAAGKQFGMSYRRAWLLVDEMNRLFESPLVIARRGGKGGGGAEVTPLGLRVLNDYEKLMRVVSGSAEFRAISRLLARGKPQRAG